MLPILTYAFNNYDLKDYDSYIYIYIYIPVSEMT